MPGDSERAVRHGHPGVICNMNFGGMLEHGQVLRSMELFASKVMPQLA
jgi:hypothetical protein